MMQVDIYYTNIGTINISYRLQKERCNLKIYGYKKVKFEKTTVNTGAVDISYKLKGKWYNLKIFSCKREDYKTKIYYCKKKVKVKSLWPIVIKAKIYHDQNWQYW